MYFTLTYNISKLLAAQLESSTKSFGVGVLVHKSSYRTTSESYLFIR